MAVKYDPDFAPRRINRWFSDAKFAADLDVNSPSTRFLIGVNSAAGATGAISRVSLLRRLLVLRWRLPTKSAMRSTVVA